MNDPDRVKEIVSRIAAIGIEIRDLTKESKDLRQELGGMLVGQMPCQFIVGNRGWNVSLAQDSKDLNVVYVDYERL